MTDNKKPREFWDEYIYYVKASGDFIWKKVSSNRIKVGTQAGPAKNSHGYRSIRLKNKRESIHRLVWLFETGELPHKDARIDHIDGNKDNNHFSNLRLVTQAENIRHRIKVLGIVPYHGVCLHRFGFYAQIQYNYKRIYIGIFKTAELAARARDRKALELDPNHYALNFPRSDYGL